MPAPPAAAAAAFDIAANASALDALYPCSDGKPMAESISHGRAIMAAAGDLEAARPDALVAADVLVYPEKGNPDNRFAPDVLAAFGLEKRRDRSSYLTWLEGKPPDWVLEVASPGTARTTCARSGAPTRRWGCRSTGCSTRRASCTRAGSGGCRASRWRTASTSRWKSAWRGGLRLVRSRVLGLDLRAEGRLLRFRDPATGEDVRHRDEEAAERKAAQARAERAEARVAELEAALQRLRIRSSDDPP